MCYNTLNFLEAMFLQYKSEMFWLLIDQSNKLINWLITACFQVIGNDDKLRSQLSALLVSNNLNKKMEWYNVK